MSTSTPPMSKTSASIGACSAKRFADDLRRPLQLGGRVEVIGAQPQVLAARICFHAARFQLLAKHRRLGVADGQESAVVGAFARGLGKQRGEQLLLHEVVRPYALDPELERELEAGERLEGGQDGR